MKRLSTIRRVDELGRIVIPKGMRNVMDIKTEDEVILTMGEDEIVIRKVNPSCVFCGTDEGLVSMNGREICAECLSRLKNEF